MLPKVLSLVFAVSQVCSISVARPVRVEREGTTSLRKRALSAGAAAGIVIGESQVGYAASLVGQNLADGGKLCTVILVAVVGSLFLFWFRRRRQLQRDPHRPHSPIRTPTPLPSPTHSPTQSYYEDDNLVRTSRSGRSRSEFQPDSPPGLAYMPNPHRLDEREGDHEVLTDDGSGRRRSNSLSRLPLSVRARMAIGEAMPPRLSQSMTDSSDSSASSQRSARTRAHLPLFNLPEEPPPELELADAQEAPPLPLPRTRSTSVGSSVGRGKAKKPPKKKVRFDVGETPPGHRFRRWGSRRRSATDEIEMGTRTPPASVFPARLPSALRPPSATNVVPNPSADGFVWISRPRSTVRLPMLPLRMEPFSIPVDSTWDLVHARVTARERRQQREEERARRREQPGDVEGARRAEALAWLESGGEIPDVIDPLPRPATPDPTQGSLEAGPSRESPLAPPLPLSLLAGGVPTRPPPAARSSSLPILTPPYTPPADRWAHLPNSRARATTTSSSGMWSNEAFAAGDPYATALNSAGWDTPGTSPILGPRWSDAKSADRLSLVSAAESDLETPTRPSRPRVDSGGLLSQPTSASALLKGKEQKAVPEPPPTPPITTLASTASAGSPTAGESWLFPLPTTSTWTSSGQLSPIHEESEPTSPSESTQSLARRASPRPPYADGPPPLPLPPSPTDTTASRLSKEARRLSSALAGAAIGIARGSPPGTPTGVAAGGSDVTAAEAGPEGGGKRPWGADLEELRGPGASRFAEHMEMDQSSPIGTPLAVSRQGSRVDLNEGIGMARGGGEG